MFFSVIRQTCIQEKKQRNGVEGGKRASVGIEERTENKNKKDKKNSSYPCSYLHALNPPLHILEFVSPSPAFTSHFGYKAHTHTHILTNANLSSPLPDLIHSVH